MLVTMRGEWGEFNPWQIPMGQGAAKHSRMRAIVYHVEDADDAETVTRHRRSPSILPARRGADQPAGH